MRKIIPFNEGWIFRKMSDAEMHAADERQTAAAQADAVPFAGAPAGSEERGIPVTLPHTWNAEDGQDGGNDYWRGIGVYTKRFPYLGDRQPARRVFLEVNGAAMSCDVLLNGQKLAHHDGGFSTFRTDLTDALRTAGLNELELQIDNRENDHVYPQKADFTFYGGLYRGVNLILVPQEHFELEKDGTPGIKVTAVTDPEKRTAAVTVETWQSAPGTQSAANAPGAQNVYITVAGETKRVSSMNGYASATFDMKDVRLWDGVQDPYLYEACAVLESGDEVHTRFGCRHFAMDPEKGFILNGRSYPLRGVARHQDLKGKGNALSTADLVGDMAIIRELGANTLRLAHYQHAQEFYDLCDENGIIVWAEIPYITMHMSAGRENTLSQMRELITQCCNHPSIAVWGLSNEITAASAVNEELLENHRALNDLCHRLDPTRPTVMANVFMLETDSPLLEIPDLNSYNLYFGWYLGEMAQTDAFFDDYHAAYPDRVIGFSEYGADANPAFHSDAPEQGDYTEEYQALYHEHMLKMIEERPYLWATHVWNLFDFAADGRDEGGKHGENQKGLVTFDRKTKKDAFYLYKAAWNRDEPFVHLCGRRYVNRCGETAEIKVYSNEPRVTLYVDGKESGSAVCAETCGGAAAAETCGGAAAAETCGGGETEAAASAAMPASEKYIFRFTVPLHEGTTKIRAQGPSSEDEMELRRVAQPDESYVFLKRGGVQNWFDAEEYDPACFSVQDTLGELRADPQAGAVVNAMMEKASASRGDVAEAVKDNPGLVRMMNRMTLISLLKQGGADEESVRQLNRVLQGIRKPQA